MVAIQLMNKTWVAEKMNITGSNWIVSLNSFNQLFIKNLETGIAVPMAKKVIIM